MEQHWDFSLSILMFREGNGWIAQCLEYDITAQGNGDQAVKDSFEKTFVGQVIVDIIHGKKPLEGISRAPKMYWDRIANTSGCPERKPVYIPLTNLPVRATLHYYHELKKMRVGVGHVRHQ